MLAANLTQMGVNPEAEQTVVPHQGPGIAMRKEASTMRIRHGAPMGLVILALSACASTPPQTTASHPSQPAERGILQSNAPFVRDYHVRTGCYTSGNQAFRFKVYTDVPDDPNHWDLLARAVTRACTDTAIPPVRTATYSITHPTANKAVMVLWKNVTSNQYGYVVAQYNPTAQTAQLVTNGGRTRLVFDRPTVTWSSGGQSVNVSFQYPPLASRDALRTFPLLFSFEVYTPI
jgi:hypothetical protein